MEVLTTISDTDYTKFLIVKEKHDVYIYIKNVSNVFL